MGVSRFSLGVLTTAIAFSVSTQAVAQDHPKAEAFIGYSYFRGTYLNSDYVGFDLSVAGNLNKWFGVVADFSHHHHPGYGGRVDSFLVGPKFTSRGTGRANPYCHTMIGAVRASEFGSTGFCWAFGGGVDVKVHRNIAIRVIDVTLIVLREHGSVSGNGRLSAGLVWRFGGK
jgi:opacity protein-like surface antigen